MSSIFLLTQKETNAELIQLGKSLFGVNLHASAIKHLQQKSTDGRLPFPRLERHADYLFGVIYIPSNAKILQPIMIKLPLRRLMTM
jgi:hypothetical protein